MMIGTIAAEEEEMVSTARDGMPWCPTAPLRQEQVPDCSPFQASGEAPRRAAQPSRGRLTTAARRRRLPTCPWFSDRAACLFVRRRGGRLVLVLLQLAEFDPAISIELGSFRVVL